MSAWADYTEYGIAKDVLSLLTVTARTGYGWHGAAQRHTSAPFAAGLTLMGVRWYNPTRGLFTGPDPVYGGNLNSLSYPMDPVNESDVSGKWRWGRRWGGRVVRFFSYRSYIDATGAASRGQWRVAGREAIYGSGSSAAGYGGKRAYSGRHRVKRTRWGAVRRGGSRLAGRVFGWPIGVTATVVDYATTRDNRNPRRRRR